MIVIFELCDFNYVNVYDWISIDDTDNLFFDFDLAFDVLI